MKSALIFVALVAITQGVPMPRDLSGKIVNGEDVELGEIPYQVSLQKRSTKSHFCGGSVLNKDYVITAAHCVQGTSEISVQVIAGTVNLNSPKSIHLAAAIIIHEQYSVSNSWQNDIALIKVEEPFVVSKTLSFVPLPQPGQEVSANTVAVVSGWGRIWQGGPISLKLQRAEILIAGQDYCSNVYTIMGYTIHDTQICAHDPVEQIGSCHGDSGGPLTVDGKLVGLVSWANGCANVRYPTVYTRVSEYIDWINANAV